ncbi:MAG: sodium:proton antiporter [Desulfobacterales bacterium]|nr:sodium:proton antiporter [Desulfobacterales bacterium]
MEAFEIIAILISLTAIFAYINYHFLKTQMSIGLMILSLFFSLLSILINKLGFPIDVYANNLVNSINFSKVLLDGMLGALLFAGALYINIDELYEEKLVIGILSSIGVITSTFIFGGIIYILTSMMQLNLRLIDCMLFGALISPTDPIAVLGILKSAGAPKNLKVQISGESLFNDGFGVVVFLILLEVSMGGTNSLSIGHILFLFITEVIGGILIGMIIGYLAYRLLKTVNNYQVEIMITLAVAVGGYQLSSSLHCSGPISVVVSGLLIGNHGRMFAMSEITREHLDMFWELIDEILNGLLFVLIGLEVLVLSLKGDYLLAGIVAIPVGLFARFISIGIPVTLLSNFNFKNFSPNVIKIMTWGGLRGGISVALALSLPNNPQRNIIITMTYVIVVFSIIIQGLTIKKIITTSTNKK